MNTFNRNTRKKNIVMSSIFGVVEQALIYLFNFIFRTVFLLFLSKSYLGISGLFTNILQIFSLSELGIGSVIAFRLYEPIKNADESKCCALMAFYKKIYRIIGVGIVVIGALMFPFLSFFIAPTSEIPSEINLNVVYWLFVVQSSSSYFFVYAQSLLASDQKNYVISFANTMYHFLLNGIKIFVLVLTKDYTLTLAFGIAVNFLYNFLFFLYIKRTYRFVFDQDGCLSWDEKKAIFKDTGALLCHKVGYVLLNSTDSLILSKCIGLVTLAIYSNYALISTALDAFLNKLLGSFVSTIGNLCLEDDAETTYQAYNRLLYMNLFLVSFCSVCFYNLINPFVEIWLDNSFLLPNGTVLIISMNMFFNSSGIANAAFINANGLFVRDKIRPLIQVVLNLVISIVLAIKIGITGVFVGTLISILLTSWWRQPVLVYKYVLKKSVAEYFWVFFRWLGSSVILSLIVSSVFSKMPCTFLMLITRFVLCGIIVPPALLLLNFDSANIAFFKKAFLSFFHKCKKNKELL